ncbi:MAG TPA: amidohydrolase family protein, partial [Candidatus Eisenbacteria bacterium]|nr:amidohydrolase family protein [Candidatus Eisenbacteria bacterium]
MAELILRNVRPMGGPVADVLARDGVITRVAPGVEAAPGATVIDGSNGILLPGLVDAHMHLDKTFWGLPWRAHEAGPTTLERIENERRLRRELRLPVDVQAERLVRQAVSRGTVHIRTHVDVDTEVGLRNFEGVMTARSRLRDTVSIQVVAFPQSGVVTRPGTAELLERAVKDGAELIGGVDPTGIDQDA